MTVPGSVWPRRVGALVSSPGAAGSTRLARPKSRILTCPSLVTKTFSGFRSRWMMPFSCAAARPLRDLQRVVHGLLQGDRARVEPAAQRLALQQLHDGEGDAVVGAEVVDREDVRMRERRDGLRLALEPRERVGIGGDGFGEDLDRDVAVELRVPRPVDLAHAARAERREDLVGAEAGTR